MTSRWINGVCLTKTCCFPKAISEIKREILILTIQSHISAFPKKRRFGKLHVLVRRTPYSEMFTKKGSNLHLNQLPPLSCRVRISTFHQCALPECTVPCLCTVAVKPSNVPCAFDLSRFLFIRGKKNLDIAYALCSKFVVK